jgi:hypothetical protein
MLTLLFAVIICGIVAWVIYSLQMPQPFKTIAIAILILIVVIIFFSKVLGVDVGIPIR